ncbi:MAG TPA: hypothetical protein VFW63_10430 [Acidimicrobiales bacterium]|nr:hypothetical protein [Acidimicrobiales bacterium]
MAQPDVYSTRFKVVAAVVVAVAAGLFTLAVLALDEGGDDPVLRGGDEAVVEDLIPRRDAQVPQQTSIGIDLVAGWDAALVVDDVEIPRQELQLTPEIGLVQFTPGPGRAVEELRPGRNCVTAVIWQLAEGRGGDDRRIPWCFEVV